MKGSPVAEKYNVFDSQKDAPKAPAARPAAPAPKDDDVPADTGGLTADEFKKLRHDIYRMWNAEPEETR
jgi:hypothetical protein